MGWLWIFIVAISFIAIALIFENYFDKKIKKGKFQFSSEMVGLILILEWACFLLGLFLADSIRGR